MHARFETPLATLEPGLRAALAPILAEPSFNGMLSARQVMALMKAGGLDEDGLCLALLPLAAACALAPVSHFNVGAIARGIGGNLYFGANMEFPGVPLSQTVHAEQSAINHAWLRGEQRLRGITVNYTPCGHCRQFMNELNSGVDIMIHLPGRAPATLAHYLPDAFGPRDLSIQSLLMDRVNHGYSLAKELLSPDTTPLRGGLSVETAQGGTSKVSCVTAAHSSTPEASCVTAAHSSTPEASCVTAAKTASPMNGLSADDPLLQQALQAANQSHAPYSRAHSGVALQLADGRIFAGRYAENAAFNPSLPPLQSALILLNITGGDCRDIRRAVLVEREALSQWDATCATLLALGCGEIHRRTLGG
ncbi:cytidine deaminase [Sodalis sp. RH15]|uniref:cytidine deaminase n=1 Tax=Sodalis sp. RH15 TaxID=3394330 RepID=UPI0039B69E0E